MRVRMRVVAILLALLAVTNAVALAQQMTTATISGSVRDAQGGVLPGVAVSLTDEARGTTVPAVTTNERGEYLVPNLAPGTYTLEAALSGFKTVRRTGIALSGGDRSTIAAITLEVSG